MKYREKQWFQNTLCHLSPFCVYKKIFAIILDISRKHAYIPLTQTVRSQLGQGIAHLKKNSVDLGKHDAFLFHRIVFPAACSTSIFKHSQSIYTSPAAHNFSRHIFQRTESQEPFYLSEFCMLLFCQSSFVRDGFYTSGVSKASHIRTILFRPVPSDRVSSVFLLRRCIFGN